MSFLAGIEGQRPGAADERRARILEGAYKVFLAYGFARTTMDDIARAAEISRPALYLVFRNKSDIYRALAAQFLEVALARTMAVLDEEAPLAARLDRMCDDVFFCMMQEVGDTPHGADLLDMKNSLAGDIIAEFRLSLDTALAAAITGEATARSIDLETRGIPADVLAAMIFDAIEGMRVRISDPVARLAGVKRLLKVIDAVLRP